MPPTSTVISGAVRVSNCALSTSNASAGAMERVRALVERIADTDVPVLLIGESGVGKDVIARRIHATSRRAERPFVKINCAALPGELLESELFGHEKGAFTGAHAEKPGKFELADQGTIFLDEIGEMDPRLQAKLLQVLQDEEFYRVGGKRSLRVDARVVVATNRDLETEITNGSFREDLYYRLNVVTISVPPLRDRKEDIVPLVQHFIEKYRRRYRDGLDRIPDDVMERFHAYDWPGNVRELENVVARALALNSTGVLGPGDFPAPIGDEAPKQQGLTSDVPTLAELSRRYAATVLQQVGGNKSEAARLLGVDRKTLYKLLSPEPEEEGDE